MVDSQSYVSQRKKKGGGIKKEQVLIVRLVINFLDQLNLRIYEGKRPVGCMDLRFRTKAKIRVVIWEPLLLRW